MTLARADRFTRTGRRPPVRTDFEVSFALNPVSKMVSRVVDDQAGLASLWSRMAALLVENKQRCGLQHWTDQKVADNAERVFRALLRICIDAKNAGARQAHHLAAFGWFLDACRAELEGRPEQSTRH